MLAVLKTFALEPTHDKIFPVRPALGLMPAIPDASAQTASDKPAVRQAALDYVEGLYTADTSRIERSVHKNLTKRGFWREPAERRTRRNR